MDHKDKAVISAEPEPSGDKPRAGLVANFLDALLFLSVLAFSAVAVIALAVAAPLALAVSAIAGAFSAGDKRQGWRTAKAS